MVMYQNLAYAAPTRVFWNVTNARAHRGSACLEDAVGKSFLHAVGVESLFWVIFQYLTLYPLTLGT